MSMSLPACPGCGRHSSHAEGCKYAKRRGPPRMLGKPAFACVSPKRGVKVDTVSVDRESADAMLTSTLIEKGYKVRRVRVVLETKFMRQRGI